MLSWILGDAHHEEFIDQVLVQVRFHLSHRLIFRQQVLSLSNLSILSSELLQVDGLALVNLQLNLQFPGHPLVKHESLQHNGQGSGECPKSLSFDEVSLLHAA